MPLPTIENLENNQRVDIFLMVKNAQVRQTGSNKPYIDFTLCDATGEIAGKKWEVEEGDGEIIAPTTLIKVRALVHEYKGKLQLKIEKMRKALPQDELDPSDFVPSAPERAEEMYQYIIETVDNFQDEDLYHIVHALLEQFEEPLLYFPGAVKNHHALRCGLLYHVKTMLVAAHKMVEVYPFLNADLLYAGVILHDMAKLLEIASTPMGIATDFTKEGMLLGHIIQGVKLIAKVAEEVDADPEKSLLLQHMILSHHNLPEYGSPRFPMFPEAEMLHHLDLLDARMYDIYQAKMSVAPGGFSERIFTLENRKVYHAVLTPSDDAENFEDEEDFENE